MIQSGLSERQPENESLDQAPSYIMDLLLSYSLVYIAAVHPVEYRRVLAKSSRTVSALSAASVEIHLIPSQDRLENLETLNVQENLKSDKVRNK